MTITARLWPHLRDASIRRKLVLVIALTCGVGIVAAGGAMFGFQIYALRSTFQRDISAVSDIVANTLSGPVAFADRRAGLEVLAALKARREIVSATVVERNGDIFVATGSRPIPAGLATTPGSRFEGWTFLVATPVIVEREAAATLVLAADFRTTFHASLRLFLIVLAVISVGALAIAIGLGYSLQGLVTGPVQRLAAAARRIGERHDYGVRVEKSGDDELGVLTDAFNAMLERLQAADAGLRQANAALTFEVEQRRQLQSELLTASRLAGMAEVATGVLHNVGNVLNSVNVSAGLMREQITASRLGTLRRTVELLASHEADLATFLTQDEKGRRVAPFLRKITDHLSGEHQRLTDELEGLTRNIDHIKEIVAMQQTHARPSAVLEEVDLRTLMDQALSIHRSALDRHTVKVLREYPPDLPAVSTDRHKVLQVLTNFVANAIHAVKVNPPGERRLTALLACADGGEVVLRVVDNGEGIPAENLPKLFRQGFTTRKEGHGFGLHSAVLIVKSLGGAVSADSAGPGLGATFTLRLPLRAALVPTA